MSENKNQKRVGYVLDIDGTRLMFTRKYQSRTATFQAYKNMQVYIGDIFETDQNTIATIAFAIGGYAVISPKMKIEVVGQRDVEVVGNQFIIKAGRMWHKIDKHNSMLQIQTSGGVLGGIEG